MKKYILIILTAALALTTSCDKWLDINDDPNSPTEAKMSQFLPGIYQDYAYYFGMYYMNIGYITSVYSHQLTSREGIDQYGITANDMSNWASIYSDPIKKIDDLLVNAKAKDCKQYEGIAKVMKAQIYSQMVDIWGDIPYSEANNVTNQNPKYDDDKEIYASLIALIKEAKIDFTTNEEGDNEFTPGDDDLIYGGDMTKWEKAANSLLLKLYVQARNTDLYDATVVNDIISTEDNYISSIDDNFSIPYGTGSVPDDRHPAMVNEYSGGQISSYISPWFYEIIAGVRATNADEYILPFEGISDPRVPYYFANQIDASNTAENDLEYGNDYMASIYFGSTGPDRDASGRKTFSMIGLYPVGGPFDGNLTDADRSDALGTSVCKGNVPQRVITAADVKYMIAELSNVGKTTNDAKIALQEAITLSFDEVNYAAELGEAASISTADINNYIDTILWFYDAATDDNEKLEIIMTQKWIQHFGNGTDSYTDYRRTGYPILFNPTIDSHANRANGGTTGTGDVPVQLTRKYPKVLPYYDIELNLNSSAPKQHTISVDQVFWDTRSYDY